MSQDLFSIEEVPQGVDETGLYVDMRGSIANAQKRKVGEHGRSGGLEHLTAVSGLSSHSLRDLSGHDFRSPQRSPARATRRSPSPLPPIPGGSSGRRPATGECYKKRSVSKVISDDRSASRTWDFSVPTTFPSGRNTCKRGVSVCRLCYTLRLPASCKAEGVRRRTSLQCLSFQVIFRFHAFVYRVEIKNCIFLEYVQKRREADDEFEFTKYIVQEITLFFNFLKKVCMK